MKERILFVMVVLTSAIWYGRYVSGFSTPVVALPLEGTTSRVSVAYDGSEGNGHSGNAALAADGTVIAFSSTANNLVPNDVNGVIDIFVYDRNTSQTKRVSSSSINVQGNDFSASPAISGDGRFVAYYSQADNLVSGDMNGVGDIFVRDRQTDQTERVSVAGNGAEANSWSDAPSLSADGRYVAFISAATNLVSNDVNGQTDVFVHDRQSGATELVSVSTGGSQANSTSLDPFISADGRYVTFTSWAGNLVANDTNGVSDIYVHDRQMGQTWLVSKANDGTVGNSLSTRPTISADGRYVAFDSQANNLVANDNNSTYDIFVHDLNTSDTFRISMGANGAESNGSSGTAVISGDGRFVAFRSVATNLVENDNNGKQDIFVYDAQSNGIIRVSVAFDGSEANSISSGNAISDDGSVTAFSSGATNLIPEDTNNAEDVFIREQMLEGNNILISHIEVTQAIQDETNSVVLIEHKPTVVRVYLRCSLDCVSIDSVTGVLKLFSGSSQLAELTTDQLITVYDRDWQELRNNLDLSLNFQIPPQWTEGEITFTAHVAGNETSVTTNFEPVEALRVAYVPIEYQGELPSNNIDTHYTWALSHFPVHNIVYIRNHTLEWDRCLERDWIGCPLHLLNKELLINKLTKVYSGLDFLVFGWLPADTYGGGDSDPDWDGGAGIAAFADDGQGTFPLGLFAHETGHLLGRRHTNTIDNLNYPDICKLDLNAQFPLDQAYVDTESDWPYLNSKIQDYGLWVEENKIMNPSQKFDFMSYCSGQWTSSWTYTQIYNYLINVNASNSLRTPAQETKFFIISGLVYDDNSVELDPTWVISTTNSLKNPLLGTDYCVETQDLSSNVLSSYCFDINFIDYESGEPLSARSFTLYLPYSEDVVQIQMLHNSILLASQSLSPNKPNISITYPTGGESWVNTGVYTITWEASDLDGDMLASIVQYSPDGARWYPLGFPTSGTSLKVDASQIAGGNNTSYIRIIASDGLNSETVQSAPFSVEPKSPHVNIISPIDGSIIRPYVQVFLRGDAYDLEDGQLSESNLVWSSNIDGNLGTGSLILSSLSPGEHIITLSGTDSHGHFSTETVNVFVGYRNYLPIIDKVQE